MTTETTPDVKPETNVEENPIQLKDKWLIWLFESRIKRGVSGFRQVKIEADDDKRPAGGELISVYYYERTEAAEKLEEDWVYGRPIPCDDVHDLMDMEVAFKRVVRRNRTQAA